MNTHDFKCVVIKNGYILGHTIGKIRLIEQNHSDIIDIEHHALHANAPYQIDRFEQAKLQKVTGWGEITHVYHIDDATPSIMAVPCTVNLEPTPAPKKRSRKKSAVSAKTTSKAA